MPCRHLSQYPRLLYFRRQLLEYNKLFGGQMEAWVAAGGQFGLQLQLSVSSLLVTIELQDGVLC
jgi:hypothetical protein